MAESEPQPGPLNYILGFTLVGIAWGLTTPFIRKAAKDHHPPAHPILESDAVRASWLKAKVYGAFFAVVDLLRNPRYAAPLLINLTGSVWFFLLIGKAGESSYLWAEGQVDGGRLKAICAFSHLCGHADSLLAELSLTVPIVNTLAFLFTVVGDWWVDGKVISRSTCSCLQSLKECLDVNQVSQTPWPV